MQSVKTLSLTTSSQIIDEWVAFLTALKLCLMVAQVGDDEFGYMLVEVLKENRVETRGCRFDPNARTALAFVTLRDDGEREFMFYRNPSADMLFETRELDTDLLRQVVFISLLGGLVQHLLFVLNYLFFGISCTFV